MVNPDGSGIMAGGQVSVLGSNDRNHVVSYTTDPTYALGKTIAGQINNQVSSHYFVYDHANASPTIAAGLHGEFVDTKSGEYKLPFGYRAVVDLALNATISGSTGIHQEIMAGKGNLTFTATGGGEIAAGDGKDSISVGGSHRWNIAVGDGNDTIDALGSGAHTIVAGTGHDSITLGKGYDHVTVNGAATVVAGGGTATIFGTKGFTFIGGTGTDSVIGGDTGGNAFTAGKGNETLVGAPSSIGSLSGTIPNRHGSDAFTFIKGEAGGHDTIVNFSPGDVVNLEGYGPNEIKNDLKHAVTKDGSTTITLSDKTTITFLDVTKLNPTSFHS
ncbi:unnamed protein product [Sphagnum tenellum]